MVLKILRLHIMIIYNIKYRATYTTDSKPTTLSFAIFWFPLQRERDFHFTGDQ